MSNIRPSLIFYLITESLHSYHFCLFLPPPPIPDCPRLWQPFFYSLFLLVWFFFFFSLSLIFFLKKIPHINDTILFVFLLSGLFYLLSRFIHVVTNGMIFSCFPLLLLLLLSHFCRVWLCVTPQTAAHQAPRFLGFSTQEYWSGLPFLSPMHASMLSRFSRVWLCATPWTAAHQSPLSTEFYRQEYWIGLPVPSPFSCFKAE